MFTSRKPQLVSWSTPQSVRLSNCLAILTDYLACRYGDKTARTRAGRVFAVVWVLVGLCISSLLIGTISSAFTSSATVLGPPDTILYGATVSK